MAYTGYCLSFLVRQKEETWVQFLGQEDPLEKEMATHYRIISWEIPWTEGPGRLQSLGSQNSWAQLWDSTTTTTTTTTFFKVK